MSSSSTTTRNCDLRDIAKSVAFFRCIGRLKHTSRQGWVERKVTPQPPEAVSSHMWRMAVMAMIFPASAEKSFTAAKSNEKNSLNQGDEKSTQDQQQKQAEDGNDDEQQQQQPAVQVPRALPLDRDRMIRMALVHDMCETIVGDATPAMKIPKDVKAKAENEAVTQILAPLLPSINGQEIIDLFHEYEENATPEAHFVHDLDILDMVLQAVDYKRQSGPDCDLLSFMDSAKKIRHPWLQQVTAHVVELFFEQNSAEEIPVPQAKLLV